MSSMKPNNVMHSSSKIFIVTYPTIGSINILLPVIHELVRNRGAQVFVYALDSFKKEIEKVGGICRVYDGLSGKDMKPKEQLAKNRLAPILNIFTNLNKLLEFNSIRLAQDINIDKPDLIFYDTMASYCKLVIDFINNSYVNVDELKSQGSSQLIPTSFAPPCIVFTTWFGFKKVIYPYDADVCLTDNLTSIDIVKLYVKKMQATRKTKEICKRLKLSYENIIENAFMCDPHIINVIFKFPDLQPRHNQISFFHENLKFVGFSIDENMHLNGFTRKKNQDRIQACIEKYPVQNPSGLFGDYALDGPKLIYVSLGTNLSENIGLYLRIVKAFEALNDLKKKGQSPFIYDFDVIISMGSRSRKGLEILKNTKELQYSDNILLATSASQIDILKRCSLFITQCGMSSVGEAIHYGVPMICLPIMFQQESIAQRVSKDFGIGLILNPNHVKVNDIQEAIVTILTDEAYKRRSIKYSKLSQENDGKLNAANVITDFINTVKQQNMWL